MKPNYEIVSRLRRKALQSASKFKIAAVGLNSKDECVVRYTNSVRFSRKGGGLHAEMRVMQCAHSKNIKTIIICRINKNGKFLPIQPCETCAEKALELGIKIISI